MGRATRRNFDIALRIPQHGPACPMRALAVPFGLLEHRGIGSPLPMKLTSVRLDPRQAVAVVGCSLMILGVVLPAWSFPIFGDVAYVQRAEIEGVMLLC